MFQLQLDFLGRQFDHFRSRRPTLLVPDTTGTVAWKHGLTIRIVRVPRARRYLLRLQPDGIVRLVIPRRGNRAEGLQFLERSETWLLRQSARWQKRAESRQPWADGTHFLFRGEEVTLRVDLARARLAFADVTLPLTAGPQDYRRVVFSHLRHLAEQELPLRTRELAQLHNIAISRVTVREQKTRWGSCSARGTISLNWRIIHAPCHVVDYLIIHELMHRREMNHSARYWKLVEDACPGYRQAEQWLKTFRLEEN